MRLCFSGVVVAGLRKCKYFTLIQDPKSVSAFDGESGSRHQSVSIFDRDHTHCAKNGEMISHARQ